MKRKAHHDILKDHLTPKQYLALFSVLFVVVASVMLVYSVKMNNPQVTNAKAESSETSCTSQQLQLVKLNNQASVVNKQLANCKVANNCSEVKDQYNDISANLLTVRQWLVDNNCQE